MNYSSNENNAISFLNKTKKQAKRLLQLAKSSRADINIASLSQAQELLAKINGYPDWHALEKTIANHQTYIDPVLTKHEKNYTIGEEHQGIKILKDEHFVSSFFDVKTIQQNNQSDFIDYVKKVINDISFSLHTGFHEIEMMVINKPRECIEIKAHHFSNNSTMFNTQPELFKKLFSVDIPSAEKRHFFAHAILVIKTKIELIDEHVKFCNFFNKYNFHIKSCLQEQEFDLFKNKPGVNETIFTPADKNFNLNVFEQTQNTESELYHKKWTHTLAQLLKTSFEWKLKVNFNNKKIFILFNTKEEEEVKKIYFSGILNAITSGKVNQYSDMFSYHQDELSAWDAGLSFYNNEEKNIFFYDPVSEIQPTNVSLIYGKVGSGKSTLTNIINCAIAVKENDKLPFVGIVDMGSSKKFIDLIKTFLPENKKHTAQFHKIEMSKKFCVNPFDTHLGSRFPTSQQEAFLINLLLLMSSHGERNEFGMAGLVSDMVKEAYLNFSDSKKPKPYKKGVNVKIDIILETIEVMVRFNASWWNVVDCLFKNNYIEEAKIAQRYAVPIISDLENFINNDFISKKYNNVMIADETIFQNFTRSMEEAIKYFSIMNAVTEFDIDEARFVSFDLEALCLAGGLNGQKKNAINYLWAFHVLKKQCLPSKIDDLFNYDLMDSVYFKGYIKYHQEKIEKNRLVVQSICLDEIHRFSDVEAFQNVMNDFVRNATPYRTNVTLSSQSLSSFSSVMVDFASSIYVLSCGNSKENEQIWEIFNIKSISSKSFFNQDGICGPRKNGQPGRFFAKFLTRYGNYEKLLSIPYNKVLIETL